MIPELSKEELTDRIAKNVAAMMNDVQETYVVNLGIGIPSRASNFITNSNVFLHAENGILGVGPLAEGDQVHPMLINAGREPILETPGCFYMDSSFSFGLIRGGHVDVTVLGALEVDQEGNIANWIIPNGKQLGVGGAMDLVAGANKVIVAMGHTAKGKAKLIKKCTLPITGVGEVDVVVTELGIFSFESGRPVLTAIAPEITVDEIRTVTELEFDVPQKPARMLA